MLSLPPDSRRRPAEIEPAQRSGARAAYEEPVTVPSVLVPAARGLDEISVDIGRRKLGVIQKQERAHVGDHPEPLPVKGAQHPGGVREGRAVEGERPPAGHVVDVQMDHVAGDVARPELICDLQHL